MIPFLPWLTDRPRRREDVMAVWRSAAIRRCVVADKREQPRLGNLHLLRLRPIAVLLSPDGRIPERRP